MTNNQEARHYWAGEPYSQTLEKVITALSSQESLVTVTAEQGLGKTALARELEDTLTGNDDAVIFIEQPPSSNAELQRLCREQQQALAQFAFMVALEKWLLQLNQSRRRCVLIIDNAHLLNAEVMTGIRIMNNLQSATHRLLQVVLLGEPNLFKVLSQSKSGGLSQRVSMQCALAPMNQGQLKQMMFDSFGLSFENSALKSLYRLSQGKPGIAVAVGQALKNEYGSSAVKGSQLNTAIGLLPDISSLRNKQRMKVFVPLLAATIAGLAIWQLWPQLQMSADTPEPAQTETAKPQAVAAMSEIAQQTAQKPVQKAQDKTDIAKPLQTVQNTDDSNDAVMPEQEKPLETVDTLPVDSRLAAQQNDQVQSQANDVTADDRQKQVEEASVQLTVATQQQPEQEPPQTPLEAQTQDNTPIAQDEALQTSADNTNEQTDDQQPDAQPAEVITEQPAVELAAQDNSNTQAVATEPGATEQNMLSVLRQWTEAWQRRDIGNYLDAYTSDFRPTNGETHEQWRARRTNHIVTTEWMRLALGDMEIISETPEQVVLRIWLQYAAPGYQDQTLKELELVLQDERWLIAKERNKVVKYDDLELTR